ncbi:hypothetical protein J1N35_014096, partial [Gossypium stocksii]
ELELKIEKQMKIQCDVCEKEAASLFCTAEEAALCGACDHRVHHANKLASKHHPNQYIQKHDRFLLTGVKLSATSALYDGDSLPQFNSQTLVNDPFSVSPASFNQSSASMTTTATAAVINKNSRDNNMLRSETCASVSSISDYL